jgi:hypothetical protein
MGFLTFKMGGRVKVGFEFRITCSDTMINSWLSWMLKLLGNCECNHLIIILTTSIYYEGLQNKGDLFGTHKSE